MFLESSIIISNITSVIKFRQLVDCCEFGWVFFTVNIGAILYGPFKHHGYRETLMWTKLYVMVWLHAWWLVIDDYWWSPRMLCVCVCVCVCACVCVCDGWYYCVYTCFTLKNKQPKSVNKKNQFACLSWIYW